MMRVLLTRPEAESRALAARLAAAGILSVVAPVLRIVPVAGGAPDLAPDLADVRALLFTSVNGVGAFVRLSPRRDLPVYAVGPATAAAARDAGFAEVESAEGNSDALAALVRRKLAPGPLALLHPSGAEVAGDEWAALEADGYAIRRLVLYRAEPAETLPTAARDALAKGTLDGVLLFSPRTAELFCRLVAGRAADGGGSPVATQGLVAYCLSAAVAAAAGGVPWRAVRIAAEPNAESLIRLVENDRQTNEGPTMKEPPSAQPGTADAPPPATPREAPSRTLGTLLPAVLVAALVAVLIGLSAPLWRGWLGAEPRPQAMPVDLAPVEARLAALARRPPPDTAPLSDAIRRLQADMARLAERPAADPALGSEIQRLQGSVDGLTRRLAEAETAMRDNRLRDRIGERALVAATALRAAAERGGPFPTELETARAALAEDAAAKEALDRLVPYAEKGVPDAGAIARRFDTVSAAIMQATRRAPNGDWMDRTVERLSSVVTVRRVEAPAPDTPDAQTAAAERARAARDVAAALEALTPIRDAVARAAPDWLATAEARRSLDAATARVSRRVATILGQDR